MGDTPIPTPCRILLYRLSEEDAHSEGFVPAAVGQQRPCTVVKQVFEDGELTGFEVVVSPSLGDRVDWAPRPFNKVAKLGDNPGDISWPPRS